ncbi:MAG: hypothetical protein HY094_07635 [Candidatus Melainabacteria bacterium]|nr:hypothetical protein [Candidatus Melainabacteria bacterium]
MISKQTEQRAEILKIAGLAFCSPLGRIFIEPIVVIKEFGFVGFLGYCIFSILVGTFGVNCILRSHEVLEEKRIK